MEFDPQNSDGKVALFAFYEGGEAYVKFTDMHAAGSTIMFNSGTKNDVSFTTGITDPSAVGHSCMWLLLPNAMQSCCSGPLDKMIIVDLTTVLPPRRQEELSYNKITARCEQAIKKGMRVFIQALYFEI